MEKVKPFLSRALVAFLFALGLALPVLGALNLMGAALPCVALLIGLCAVLTAASMNRKVGLAALIASVAGLAIYLLALGGIQTVREAIIGVILQLSGVQGALPMVAGPCAILLTLIFGLLCWALTSPGAGFYPGLAVLLLVMMILWLTSRTNLLLYTLPGLAALRLQRAAAAVGAVVPGWAAIEELGGVAPEREFDNDDPDYAALQGME